ncbi:hydrolase [Gracilibacillus boraciitolerans JCM 21714]|uniref:Hydrolase n=1 Tax=Gracilibacillus boraciitolerans JCM 21714 TaxID=1298598 RepID=W4VGA7_9BACI|nr:Cof-type HAD-IIB family hydrolase [Gracilibacillus boraciitolerans]GAE92201.1 hydrolase [Gracilibacillus boraciitolerans JCM 21714]
MIFLPKAICLDMDGTLLNNQNRLTEQTVDKIQEIRKMGIRAFIVTGRSYNEIFDTAPKDLDLDGFVSSNGMITYVDNQKILEHYLPTDLVQKVILSARNHAIYYEVHPNDGERLALKQDQTYMNDMINGDKPDTVATSEWLERKAAVADDIAWTEKLPNQKYSKMYCFHIDPEVMKDWIGDLEEMKKETDFTTSSSSRNNVEIMVENVNKSTGIQALLNHFDIKPEETMAIGDSNNDIPMMQYVGYPVAMKNATPQIKALVKDETEYTNDKQGVYHYLNQFFQHK